MAAWALAHPPWVSLGRIRLRADLLGSYNRAWTLSKTYFSTPLLAEETPSMKALRAHSYPTAPLDSSIFEDEMEDYPDAPRAAQKVDATSHVDVRRACHILARLVGQKEYVDAERVRSDLVEMGTTIEPDQVYERLARHIASTPAYPNRTEAFGTWLSLIPDRKDWKGDGHELHNLRSILLRSPSAHHVHADLGLVVTFGLITAAKGYAVRHGSKVAELIARYGDPKLSVPFLRRMAATLLQHDQRRGVKPRTTRDQIRSWYDAAIKAMCVAGRTDAALDTMRQGQDESRVYASEFTYRCLLLHLLAQKRFDDLRAVAKMAVEHHPWMEGSVNTLLRNVKRREQARTTAVRGKLDRRSQFNGTSVSVAQPQTVHGLAQQVRDAKRALTSPTPTRIESIRAVIKNLALLDRSRTLQLLRQRAERHSNSALSRWVLALMQFHRNRDERELVIFTFLHYCDLVGVPNDTIDEVVKQSVEGRRGLRLFVRGPSLPDALWNPPQPQRKIHPSPAHTSLVWEAAVILAKDDAQLKRLYAQLLADISRVRNIPLPDQYTTPPPTSPFAITTPPSHDYDSAHFMPFIFRYVTRFGADGAFRVLNDMRSLNVAPSLHLMTHLLGALAREGRSPEAWRWLEFLERGDAGPDMVPNIVAYTTLMRGFVRAGRWTDAVRVAGRMKERLSYIEGRNKLTDAVLAEIREYLLANPTQRNQVGCFRLLFRVNS
jgi:pentatricopeptide repeat protein